MEGVELMMYGLNRRDFKTDSSDVRLSLFSALRVNLSVNRFFLKGSLAYKFNGIWLNVFVLLKHKGLFICDYIVVFTTKDLPTF